MKERMKAGERKGWKERRKEGRKEGGKEVEINGRWGEMDEVLREGLRGWRRKI